MPLRELSPAPHPSHIGCCSAWPGVPSACGGWQMTTDDIIARGRELAASGKYEKRDGLLVKQNIEPEPAGDEPIPLPPEPPHLVRGPAEVSEPSAGPDPDPATGHSGQVRMAYRLAAAYADQLLHVHGLGWHYFDGTRWKPDDIGAATRAVLDVLRLALAESLGDKQLRNDVTRCESHSGVQGVLGIAAALTPFAATVRDLDADPYLLNVANGTLDLRTLTMSPHRPADRLTKVTRAAWRTDTTGESWQQFLGTVLPDAPVRAYVQRHIGMALLGRVTEHVLSIWTGRGANGKGTAIGALCFALGDYASTAEPDLLLHRQGAHPTGEMDLLGRRLVVMSESDEGRRLAEATMKRLTGGDTIRARRMRQDFIEFTPSHTPILVTNHLPVVSGDDPAVWRRLRVVPFDVVIPEHQRDGDLPERLEQAADEVLAWALTGWSEYQRIGLAEPDDVRARTSEYQFDSDAVGRFITDCCLTSSSVLKATTSQLFDAWEKWRGSDGADAMSRKAFGQALDRHGYPAGNPVHGKRWRNGIGLLGGDSDE